MEEWKQIPYVYNYEVSNLGNIRNKSGKLLKGWINSNGYIVVCLYSKKRQHYKKLHQLILETFIGNRTEGYDSHHKDECKLNNRLENLEYLKKATHAKLQANRFDFRTINLPGRGKKLNKENVTNIKILLRHNIKQKDIAKQFNVSINLISLISCGKIWTIVD